ncbi:MAG TPA: 4Fe-4S ferredoxin [Alphaproteobacteria bacterium]|nr:4Fe-4S ferredoxin [Alphaproteobacteria bacterium]HAJ46369.1 4Fe-4S ferredoxin [Alphaproteobacteria bacterium]
MSRVQTRATPEECKQPSGTVRPLIDHRRCEGAAACAAVCPHDVFEVRKITRAEQTALPLLPWLKVLAHGGRQAFAINADACQACGACIAACPEKAIRLERV